MFVSKAAERRLRGLREKHVDHFLKIEVEGGGCQGFKYIFLWTAQTEETDQKVLDVVVVSQTAWAFVEGSTLDYIQTPMESEFVVGNNPQAVKVCGCKTSFQV